MAIKNKGGFKSEDTGEFFLSKINIPNHYPEQKRIRKVINLEAYFDLVNFCDSAAL